MMCGFFILIAAAKTALMQRPGTSIQTLFWWQKSDDILDQILKYCNVKHILTEKILTFFNQTNHFDEMFRSRTVSAPSRRNIAVPKEIF